MVERAGFETTSVNPSATCNYSDLQKSSIPADRLGDSDAIHPYPQGKISDDVAKLIQKIIKADLSGTLSENIKVALLALLNI